MHRYDMYTHLCKLKPFYDFVCLCMHMYAYALTCMSMYVYVCICTNMYVDVSKWLNTLSYTVDVLYKCTWCICFVFICNSKKTKQKTIAHF